jgi:hypothetical protein
MGGRELRQSAGCADPRPGLIDFRRWPAQSGQVDQPKQLRLWLGEQAGPTASQASPVRQGWNSPRLPGRHIAAIEFRSIGSFRGCAAQWSCQGLDGSVADGRASVRYWIAESTRMQRGNSGPTDKSANQCNRVSRRRYRATPRPTGTACWFDGRPGLPSHISAIH